MKCYLVKIIFYIDPVMFEILEDVHHMLAIFGPQNK